MRLSRRMPTLTGLVVALGVVAAPDGALARQVALVVGNSAYEHTTVLANPRNDAEAMASKLRVMGFDVIEGVDLDKAEMGKVMQEFVREARDAEVSLMFYAGHGIAVDGQNYLIPIDAALDDISAIDFEAIPLDVVTRQLGYGNGADLIILDACRDNPLATKLASTPGQATRSVGAGGLAKVDAESKGVGMGIAFATSPGELAQDGAGEHSPFTASLLQHIGTPNVPITSIMNRVTGDVVQATGEKQRPWFNQSFTDDVVLYRVALPAEPAPGTTPAAPEPGAVAAGVSAEDDRYAFDLAREGGTAADYELYISLYPTGRYVAHARQAIERLRGAGTEVAALAPTEAEPTLTRSIPAYDPGAPLVLTATPEVRGAVANEFTETALLLDQPKRAEIQARLTATGNDVGGADGAFGGNTRRGISGWQTTNGLAPTGYLNALQLALLTSQTEATYAAFLQAPVAKAPSSGQSKPTRTASSGSSSKKKTQAPSSGGGQTPAIVDGFIKGASEAFGRNSVDKLFGR